MALHLNSYVSELPGIGAKAVKDLKNMGILSVYDLLFYVPFRYDDFSNIKPIAKVKVDEMVTVSGSIVSIDSHPAKNSRMTIVNAVIEDETGELPIIWFNQKYLIDTLRPGMRLSFSGRIDFRFRKALVNPVFEPEGKRVHTGRIVPVYGLSGSLTMKRLRTAINCALSASDELIDWVPEIIRSEEGHTKLSTTIRSVHFPESHRELSEAIERLKFDELLLHQFLFARSRQDRKKHKSFVIPIDEQVLKTFVAQLPFELTFAQKKSAWEIVQDLAKPNPMNRLLQGDVGSGKTVVAAIAANSVLSNKFTVVYLVPTEILAVQQHAVFSKFLPSYEIALFTRSQKRISDQEVKKEEVLNQLKNGTVQCVIGTHALLEEMVEIPNLAFVIVDEQHRFGVAQRHALLEKGSKISAHLLSMTATPIPRSLSLTIYGDLDISVILELPKGRKPIGTAIIESQHRTGMWQHVKDQIALGRQIYVVCPLIDPSDKLGAKSVTDVSGQLKKGPLKDFKINVLHGKLKSDEKQDAIQKFKDGKTDVLVSTTVVEVGVDVPNATVMVIFGAERFGLAQLHQLRGRVGRSDMTSYCYLLSDDASEIALERLRTLEQTQNGFELAEKDLELRGPGNIFGNAQSGFPDFQFATSADVEIMKTARDWTTKLLNEDPKLEKYPLILEKIYTTFEEAHLE
ncbi:ATP-dependent DNA helicase RecG [Candidatus Uhrbacteria bacterium]|nr:ATP-dependent DNA helicase RecG [Candidatus Uhrbacteria bacterium]